MELAKGIGCSHCQQTGYSGRIAVFEIIKMDAAARSLIVNGKSADEIREYFNSIGCRTLADNCRNFVLEGVTTTDELRRISYSVEG